MLMDLLRYTCPTFVVNMLSSSAGRNLAAPVVPLCDETLAIDQPVQPSALLPPASARLRSFLFQCICFQCLQKKQGSGGCIYSGNCKPGGLVDAAAKVSAQGPARHEFSGSFAVIFVGLPLSSNHSLKFATDLLCGAPRG
jgi:hypothetical protein